MATWVGERDDWKVVPSLDGCWTKYERGMEHFDELVSDIDTHPKEIPMLHEYKPGPDDTGTFLVKVGKVPDMPRRWSAIVGDVVHNFRSVLDHLAWQLAVLNLDGKQMPSRKTAFVIADDEAQFRKEAPIRLRSLHPRHVAHIETLQPYRGSPYFDPGAPTTYAKPLGWLRDLSNIDKHQALHGTYLGHDFNWYTDVLSFGGVREYESFWWSAPWPIHEELILIRLECKGVTDDPWFEISYPLHPRIVFGVGIDVREALEKIRLAVGRVLQEFEPTFRQAGLPHWTIPLEPLQFAEDKSMIPPNEPDINVFRLEGRSLRRGS